MALNKKTYEYNFPIELFDVGNKYSRNDIDQRLEKVRIDGWKGVTEFLNCFALVVTIEKANKPKNHKYKDFFKNRKEFFWESQEPEDPRGVKNKFGSPNTPQMICLLSGEKPSILFARINEKTKGKTNKFIYCGEIEVESFDYGTDNLKPFGVKFTTKEIPKEIPLDLSDLINWKPENNSSLVEAEKLASTHTLDSEADENESEGQGIITNQQLKKAIEDYAMEKAFDHYKSQGYTTFDVSKKKDKGYDIECEKPGSTKFVEVKGTYKNGWCVLVTANEVKTAKKKPVDLFIVNKINYRWIDDEFECYDGELRIISPWKPKSNKSSLKEISYKFCPEK